MENRESLRQYFQIQRNNIEGHDILDIFLDLDYKLSIIHKNGFSLKQLNSDNIFYEDGFNFSTDSFVNYASEEDKANNIVDLAKLNLGTQVSVASGFSDFTVLVDDVIEENFSAFETSLLPAASGDKYLETVLVKGARNIYYNDYLSELKQSMERSGSNSLGGNTKARTKVLSTAAGRAFSEPDEIERRAYVDLLFYPILIALSLLVAAVAISLF